MPLGVPVTGENRDRMPVGQLLLRDFNIFSARSLVHRYSPLRIETVSFPSSREKTVVSAR
jgi:hypothetical protein